MNKIELYKKYDTRGKRASYALEQIKKGTEDATYLIFVLGVATHLTREQVINKLEILADG